MAKKVRPVHVCTDCGYQAPKWLGRCPECGAWGTLNEQLPSQPSTQAVSGQSTTPQPITSIPVDAATATTTGIAELDRVLGNGLVPGSVVLLSGEPGVGKSTLLLDVAAHAARANNGQNKVLYATAEESTGQVRLRAERTGALDEKTNADRGRLCADYACTGCGRRAWRRRPVSCSDRSVNHPG